jgi:uncharacterized membrane protein YhaH (DUF805 family)
MDIKQAITVDMKREVEGCFKKYADFSGRASLPEFWYFFLFCITVGILTALISDTLNMIASLALLLPSLAVGARRLHDTGRTGWWQLLILTVIGYLVLLFLCAQKSEAGANKYGPAA